MRDVVALSTFRGPHDRLGTGTVRTFVEGDRYRLPSEVAGHFVDAGLASFVDAPETERKVVDAGEFAATAAQPLDIDEGAEAQADAPPPLTVEDLPRSGTWYTLPNGEKVQGHEAAAEALEALG